MILEENISLGKPLTLEQLKTRDILYKVFTCVWLSLVDAYLIFLGINYEWFILSLVALVLITIFAFLDAVTFSRWQPIRSSAESHLNTLCELTEEASKYREEVFVLKRSFTEGEYRKIYEYSMAIKNAQIKKQKKEIINSISRN